MAMALRSNLRQLERLAGRALDTGSIPSLQGLVYIVNSESGCDTVLDSA